jgi:hypothetical protein
LAAFDEARRISLLDVAAIELQLSELLGQSVELVEEGTLKPRVQRSVEAEALHAFPRKFRDAAGSAALVRDRKRNGA